MTDAGRILVGTGARSRIHGRGFAGHHRSPKSGVGKCRSGVATPLAGALALRRAAGGDVNLGMPAEPMPQYPANLRPPDPLAIVAGLKRGDDVIARYSIGPIAMLPDQGVRCIKRGPFPL